MPRYAGYGTHIHGLSYLQSLQVWIQQLRRSFVGFPLSENVYRWRAVDWDISPTVKWSLTNCVWLRKVFGRRPLCLRIKNLLRCSVPVFDRFDFCGVFAMERQQVCHAFQGLSQYHCVSHSPSQSDTDGCDFFLYSVVLLGKHYFQRETGLDVCAEHIAAWHKGYFHHAGIWLQKQQIRGGSNFLRQGWCGCEARWRCGAWLCGVCKWYCLSAQSNDGRKPLGRYRPFAATSW